MHVSRRTFVTAATTGAAALALRSRDAGAQARGGGAAYPVPPSILGLKPLPNPPPAITDSERRSRIEAAQRLMIAQGIGAIVLESGTSMSYFTGVRWGLSERPFLLVMPAKGDLAYVAPGFEEQRAREVIRFSSDVRVWQEDEDPLKLVAGILKDRGVPAAKIGVEERVRFFIADALQKANPAAQIVLATPVTAGCRMIKSPAEIACLQYANDITLAAYRAGLATLREGMTQGELAGNITAAYRQMGANGAVSVMFGKYTAFPHGSIEPQRLREGDIVMIDDGVSWEGYQSDITRTTVFGKATPRQIEVWNLEKKAQAAAFAAAQVGATCESVDAAARKVITDAGFGPGYKVPGLPHRTGHGIGMDGHEWTNFVKGNTTKIQPGMCFSDEPMIAIYGEFGIRLEDCLHITPAGPKFFTEPSAAIDRPFA
ncbi:MAG TPA: Xaa-Pro peptidase family protein [Vicinamibacterales bacterium]|nr:Xaa-Pro peptidase family protein [Vicinamibacterales bacterium]